MKFDDPKLMAMILTQEGFIRWTEGNPLIQKDFKPQWAYLAVEVERAESRLREETP